MSDTICLHHKGDFYCVLPPNHPGPHQAMTDKYEPRRYPGGVWEQEGEHV